VRFAVDLPPFGEFAEPATVVELAVAAEEAGWDGFFLWDHVMRADTSLPVSDAWVILAAVACATSRIRIGPMVTPLPRRRPWIVARQAATLDRLSGGRLVLGVGIGNDRGRELSAFGEETDPKARGLLLDESLDVITGLWSGEQVSYAGERLRVDDARFVPTPVQRPRVPIWAGGEWPNRAPLRRAARYDGAFPVGVERFDAADVARLLDVVREHRAPDAGPFDVVLSGRGGAHHDGTPADLAGLAEAGLTWWVEALEPADTFAAGRALVTAGPPR
jgi:probable F420-dependent oxidoreductase